MEPNLNTNFNPVTFFLYTHNFIYTCDMYILLCFGNAGIEARVLWIMEVPYP